MKIRKVKEMHKFIKSIKNKKGFTLIELIVVLAVLAIIMAIAVPRFIGVQNQAKLDADESTKDMVLKAAELYYINENEPSSFTIENLVNKGYLEEFALQADTDNDTYDKVKDNTITVTKTATSQSIDISW